MPSAIILAAGSSTRLGQPKQSLRIANETLLERAIRIAHLAGLAPIFVVVSPALAQSLGASNLEGASIRSLIANAWAATAGTPPGDSELAIASSTQSVEVLLNHHAAEGMASSIRLGIRGAIEAAATGAVILACDQIAVTPQNLRSLTEMAAEVRASSYAGRHGIPAYFPESAFEALLQLTGDTGARDLLRHAKALPLVNGDLDIDTPADLARAQLLFRDK